MRIDIERLKRDRAYWDSVAPDGAETFGPGEGLFVAGWYKKKHDGVCFTAEDENDWQLIYKMERDLIPRPQSEWVDGLPPVGDRVEVWIDSRNCWATVTVLAVDIDTVVWRNGTDRTSYIGTHIDNIRPLAQKPSGIGRICAK